MTRFNVRIPVLVSALATGMLVAAASGQVSVTVGTSAPAYQTTLNFDEPGGPTGQVGGAAWTGIGVTELVSGTGVQTVTTMNTQPGFGWLGTGNVFVAPFGAFMKFSQDLTGFSSQFWDNSGPGGPFGGGALVVAFNDGVEVASQFITNPAYGGTGSSWVNVTGANGATFDEVRMLGFGFSPTSYIDNLSWNVVPAPAAAAVFGLGGLVLTRRRRS